MLNKETCFKENIIGIHTNVLEYRCHMDFGTSYQCIASSPIALLLFCINLNSMCDILS